VLALCAPPVSFASAAPEPGGTARILNRVTASEVVADSWVAGLDSGEAKGAALGAIVAAGGTATDVSIRGDVIQFEASAEVAQQLSDTAGSGNGIRYVEPLVGVTAEVIPADSYYSQQWGLSKISAPAAWDVSKGSSSVVIAIIDTGVDLDHSDLAAHIDAANGYDFVNDDSSADDDHGHGTHVAGIAAAMMNGSYGVGVAPNCTILPVKVLDASGSGTSADVAAGIEWAADQGAEVINMSLGSSSYTSVIAEAVAYAISKDVVVCAATGNEGIDSVCYPAAYPGVIGVGATGSSDAIADFSNYGPGVDIAAPGENIVSTSYTGAMTTMSGTSMATPFVAGAAALVRSVYPSYTQAEVALRLQSTATDKGTAGRDDYFGYGRLNVAAAVGGTVFIGDDDIPGVPIPASPVSGSVGNPSDMYDVYAISLTAGQALTANLAGTTGDLDLFLYGPGATGVGDATLRSSTGSGANESISYTGGASGTYYLAIEAHSGSGSYTLTYQKGGVSSSDDQIPGIAIPASPVTGSVANPGDMYDVYQIPLTTGQVLSVNMTGATGDLDLFLYGPATTSVGGSYVAGSIGLGANESISYTAASSGTYYLAVEAHSGSGSYTLTYSKTGGGSGSSTNIPGVPIPASPFGRSFALTDDTYVYRVPLGAGQTISVSCSGASGSDFDLYLYGPAATDIFVDTSLVYSSGTGSDESVLWSAAVAGDYYIVMHRFSGSGSFMISYSVATGSSDDDIPGVAAPASPIVGSLGAADDEDVYRVYITAGQKLSVSMTGPSDADFDLYLYGPDATRTSGEYLVCANETGSTESLSWVAQTTGFYYLDVYHYSGEGAYSVSYSVRQASPTSIDLSASTSSPPYRGSLVLQASVADLATGDAVGGTVTLYGRPSSSAGWARMDSRTVAGSAVWYYTAPLAYREYMAEFADTSGEQLPAVSAQVSVRPKVYVSTPIAPSRMTHGRGYTVKGYLKPRHTSGTYPVRIYKYKYVSGAWKSYGYVTAKATNYSTYTKYSRSVSLPSSGRWRLRAYHASDAANAESWSSGYDYVTVR
jgi:thermitase